MWSSGLSHHSWHSVPVVGSSFARHVSENRDPNIVP